MGIKGRELPQEDTKYYEKVSFGMNILVCGNYNRENIINEMDLVEEASHRTIPEWKYYFFRIDEQIGQNTYSFIQNSIIRKNDYKNLLLFYSGLKNYTVDNLLNFYDKKDVNYHPCILIIARKNENIVLPELTKFNRNLIKISRENDRIDKMINIIQFATYYNQLGDEIGFPKQLTNRTLLERDNYLITKYLFTINILICGRLGAGKSTLINAILGKEKSYAKRGYAVTKKIVKYIHEEYPLVLYDSPGLESEDDIKAVENLIKQKNESLNEGKNRIHCIFYVLNTSSERGFLKGEPPFLANLIRKDMDIFIISTHAETEENSEEFIEATRIQIMQNANGSEPFEELRNYIYPVELKNTNQYSKFGLKEVFKAIYKKYERDIESDEINKGNISRIRSKFLIDILTKENLKLNLTALALRVKANFKLLAASLGKGYDVRTTNLAISVIKIISKIYNHNITTKECLDLIENIGFTNEFSRQDSLRRNIEKLMASVFYFNGPASKAPPPCCSAA